MESFMVYMGDSRFFVDNGIKAFWHETIRKIHFYRIPKIYMLWNTQWKWCPQLNNKAYKGT